MEMLNKFSMLLSNDLWKTLITLFANWLTNYGWAIILFTVVLKLVMSPLDFFQRKASTKQSAMMNNMKPEMDALQKKYGNDREKLNQETMKLYKKHNVSLAGMCLPMLGTMVLSMVVFFTLFGSLKSFGNEKLYSSYNELDNAYVQTVNDNAGLTEEELDNKLTIAVEQKYDEISKKNSWLWVKNVWKSDTNTSQFVDVEDYIKEYKANATEEEKAQVRDRYEDIKAIVNKDKKDSNGYYVLIVLAVAISFLTQFLSAKLMTPKGQKLNTMNKVMFVVIPATMIIFALSSNVVFTLYIITNSIMTSIISTALFFINKKNNKGGDVIIPKRDVQVVEYSRNYKK